MSDWFLLWEPRHSWECRRSHRQLVSQWRAGLWGSLHHGSPVGANWIQLAHCNALQRFATCSSHLFTFLDHLDRVSMCELVLCGETFYIILSTWWSWFHKVSGNTSPCLVHLRCSLEKPGMQVKNVTFQWTLWGTISSQASYLSQHSAGTHLHHINSDHVFAMEQRIFAINKSCVEFCIRILYFLHFSRELRIFWSYSIYMELHSLTQSMWSHMWWRTKLLWSTSETVAVRLKRSRLGRPHGQGVGEAATTSGLSDP